MSYTIIISEKPDASKRIAEALAEEEIMEKSKRDSSYYEIIRNGKKLLVVPAVGHLYTLKQNSKGWTYPVFDVEWREAYKVRKSSAFSEKYFLNIKELSKGANDYIIATDYDIEGSVIGYNILRYLCERENAKRMKFSTLTKADLLEAYESMSNTLDKNLIDSGITRHILDFYWGVNASRALTLALNKAGKIGFQILSAGRVQAPALFLLTKRERIIKKFKPKPFWEIYLHGLIKDHLIIALHETKKIWDEKSAKNVLEISKGKQAKVSKITEKKYKHKPPTPFNITSLQIEAYRFFGYTPDRTLNIAQNLYTRGHISYPRTSSEKLPPKIGYEQILKAISKFEEYRDLANELLSKEKLVPHEGRRTDPAHPAIFPSAEPPKKKLSGPEGKVYDLVVRRFMAVFGEPAIRESIKIEIAIDGQIYFTHGRRTLEKNWHRFYGPYAKFEEQPLPELKEGDVIEVKEIKIEKKETQPPNRYTAASLVKEMENRELGTKATRAEIIKTLFDRRYIEGKSIKVTMLGEAVVDTLEKYVPDILSEKLTREFENKIELIQEGKANQEKVVEEAKQILIKILEEFKKREKQIGESLVKSFKAAERERNYIGECPNCKGSLKVIYSRRTRKRFVGCSGYPKCNTSFPLPQFGYITSLGENCEECGYPRIQVKPQGRRPFRMCINHKCKTKEGWGKKKKAKSKK